MVICEGVCNLGYYYDLHNVLKVVLKYEYMKKCVFKTNFYINIIFENKGNNNSFCDAIIKCRVFSYPFNIYLYNNNCIYILSK